jgi:hypothetical protein
MSWFSCNLTPERFAEICPEGFCSISCFPIGTVALSVLVMAVLLWLLLNSSQKKHFAKDLNNPTHKE